MDEEARRVWHAVGDVLGSKWALHVIRALETDPRGFNALRRALDGVSAKTLSERLSELRCLGLVEKEVHASSPPRTTYRLSPHGEAFAEVVADIDDLVDVVECAGEDCPVVVGATPDCGSCEC